MGGLLVLDEGLDGGGGLVGDFGDDFLLEGEVGDVVLELEEFDGGGVGDAVE